MFASLLRPKSSRPTENTPLLAALNKYRQRQNGEASEPDEDQEFIAQYEDGGEDEDEDEDRQRDGPLLPVFSSEVLGKPAIGPLLYTQS